VGQRWGLRNKINESIATKKLTIKKPHPSSPLEKMGGAIDYKKGGSICHFHDSQHEVHHHHLHVFT
jgi:hypothetical protein